MSENKPGEMIENETMDLLNSVKQEVEKKPPINTSHFTVVKRNGTLVPFRLERITQALIAAFRDTKHLEKGTPLTTELTRTINHITELVVEQLAALTNKGVTITVEGIQDLVEITLMKKNFHDVARDYIIYRDHHKAVRQDSPENISVTRNDGQTVRFKPIKVASTFEKAFRD
ncbi:MAG: ATP cone domain-containing protein, partial [Simkaniaceae bacterium]|nr:ATP cone domain-containing protein [Simkaniaceae bacterium]